MTKLTKTDMLFIRAMKGDSELCLKRLEKLYKSRYLGTEQTSSETTFALCQVITGLVRVHLPPLDLYDVYTKLNPNQFVGFDKKDERSYDERYLQMLISHVRYKCDGDYLSSIGHISPLRLRNKRNK